MLGLRRPPEPASFAAAVREPQRAVEAALATGSHPEFPDVWSRFKGVFIRAQANKCGYCELRVKTSTGAMDHYRPKGALEELPANRALHGHEEGEGCQVKGRKLVEIVGRGYAWAAYTWENYVFVCERCNTGWKRCLFPVAERPRTLPPVQGEAETPLLLNPFDDEPTQHLDFNEFGEVVAREESLRGQATIDTCGLWRESLRRSRAELARQVEGLLARFDEPELENASLRDLWRLGDAQQEHAGMVRAMVATMGLPWRTLEKLVAGS